ncbi:unnamed protein product [Cuscuta epithymum]|uniref:Reverse transcriptase Ty1/copia-type domain-containing protein n=1 Tax=Cuscuta epithymum TaxID=186058 RepID=A0AAV0DIE4_9ASTE|nr:unnamed protein product [Cuscuta epithymum]
MLYNPVSGKVIVSKDIKFDEGGKWSWSGDNQTEVAVETIEVSEPTESECVNEQHEGSSSSGSSSTTFTPHISPSGGNSIGSSSIASSYSPGNSSSGTPPKHFWSLRDVYRTCNFALCVTGPVSYEEVAKEEIWEKAMQDEMAAMEKNDTWQLVYSPKDKNIIGLKWVFRTTYNSDGSVQKDKARLVAKGYSQQQGVDYEENFSPVARFETVRVFLCVAAQFKLPVFQLDVKSAFLNSELEEEVYVSQPEGFAVHCEEEKVYKL